MTLNVLWLFLTMPWVGLQCVIVIFLGTTHLLSEEIVHASPLLEKMHMGQVSFLITLYLDHLICDLSHMCKVII